MDGTKQNRRVRVGKERDNFISENDDGAHLKQATAGRKGLHSNQER